MQQRIPGDSAPASPEARTGLLSRMRDRDHTQGRMLTSLVVLSLPSLLTMVLGGALFQLVDLRFLGQLGADAVAAAGATNQTLRQFLFLLIFGVSVAVQMMISRLVGEGRTPAAEHVAGQTLVVGLAVSLLCALLGLFFAEPLVGLVVRDPAVVPLAVVYVRVSFLVLGGNLFIQLGSSVLNGAGDTTTPMFITLLITPVGLVAEWALAFGKLGAPELGITGIALGAGVGSLAGLAIMFWALASGRCRVHLRRRHLLPDAALLRRLIGLSWQPALHMVARTAIVFFFMWLAGRLGGKVQAAYTIGLRLEMPAFMIAFTIANACATLVGQNLGARRLDRAWSAIRLSFLVELAMLWPIALALFLYRYELVSLFTDDPEVLEMAAQYLLFSASIMVFYGLYFVSFRSLQAAGDMNSPMLISVVSAIVVGAPLGWVLATRSDLGATGMWIANLCYALLNACVMIGWLLTGRWSRRFRLELD